MESQKTRELNLADEFLLRISQADPDQQADALAAISAWMDGQKAGIAIPEPAPDAFAFVAGEPTLPHDPTFETNRLEKFHINRQIADNLEQVFWLRDQFTGKVEYVSPRFEAIWGISSALVYEHPSILIECVHPEDRVQVIVANSHVDRKPSDQTYRIIRPDESIRWIHHRAFLIDRGRGYPPLVFNIAQDISDQKQIELAVRKTLDSLREQFDLSRKMSLARKPEAVMKTLMTAHELSFASYSAMLYFTNPQAGPMGGMEVSISWSADSAPLPALAESSFYEDPAILNLLLPHRPVVVSQIEVDGRLPAHIRDELLADQYKAMIIFPLMASGTWQGCMFAFYTEKHVFDYMLLRHLKILIDQASISLFNLKLLSTEKELRIEAERANQIKTEFLAMISHELRTPLTSIIGFTTTLLADDVVWEPDESRDFTLTIQQEANRLQELIDHLLDLSQLEAGMLPILLKPHLMQEILADSETQFQTLTRNHLLVIHLPANLLPVNVDAKRIAQVLVNLVRNAATYSPTGTEIGISASNKAGYIQVNVSDQGPGIPVAEHKRVFQAFQRGKTAELAVGKGAGLGLAICRGLVEAHGGHIWIKRKNSPGTTFSFTLPAVAGDTPVEILEVN